MGTVTKDTAALSWDAPSGNGGSPLTGYVIEKRDASKKNWMNVTTITSDRTSHTVTRLFEDTEYYFRVAAENAVGTGEYVEISRPVTAKLPYREWKSSFFAILGRLTML